MNSQVPAPDHGQRVEWPVRSGPLPPLADGYVARPESAPDLHAALAAGSTVVLTPSDPATQASDWLDATGKTQLAVAFAEKLQQSRQADLLVWVSASSRMSVLTGYAAAAAAIGAGTDGPADVAAARFVSWLSDTSRPWAVVLDDVRDPADLEDLWPAGPAGRVLVTTARSPIVAAAPRPLVVPLGAFSTHEALGYLMGRLSADPDKRLGAIDLVEDLGCEPMALAQASAVIASSDLSCREYQELLARRRPQVAGGSTAASAITWTLSANHAGRLSPGGAIQPLLALVALLDGHAIPGTVLIAPAALDYLAGTSAVPVAGPQTAWSAVHSLERAGLVTLDPATTPPTVRISGAVQQGIRTTAPEALLSRAARAAADALLEVWPEGEPDRPLAWPATGLLACAASLQQITGTALWQEPGLHPLLLRAGRSLDNGRLTGPAVTYWTELAGTSDRILGASNPDTLTAGSQLAMALANDGQVAEAVSWARWVLAGRARVLGADDPESSSARVALARALLASGQLEEAISLLETAAAAWERTSGTDHTDTLAAQEELGLAYAAAGKPSAAIALYKRTLALRERSQGPEHPDTLTTRQRLTDLCGGRWLTSAAGLPVTDR
jgi:Tetratricopeptide repeat